MPDEEVRRKYAIDELLRRIPDDRAEFFTGFSPSAEDLEGFGLSSREWDSGNAGRSQLRTIWDSPKDRDSRLLIDVFVRTSAADALEALATQLSYNQLDRLPAGPEDLGLVSYIHAEPAPPAVFFVRGNLSIFVASFGRKPLPAIPVARRLSMRLAERPKAERRAVSLAADPPRGKPRQEIVLRYQIPFRIGADGYWKFFVTGGTVLRQQDRLVLVASEPASLRVEAFVIESGREPLFGELSVAIE